MRVLVGDIFGRCRFVDAWNNKIKSVASASGDRLERSWCADAMVGYSDRTRACMIHSNGYASFVSVDNEKFSSTMRLCRPTGDNFTGRSVRCEGDHFVATYNGKCITFTERNTIGSFDTVEGSCSCSFGNQCAVGRIADRTLIYDIDQQQVKWTAAEPPFDELKIQLEDNDSSVMFADENLLIVGQQMSTVLVYDIRSGNTPVVRHHVFDDLAITTMTMIEENRFMIGDTSGSVLILDLNTPRGRLEGVKGFKGSTGGILQIDKHPTLPLIGVLSCSRILSIYDQTSVFKKPTKEAFVKNMSKCFMFTNDEIPMDVPESDDEWEKLPEDDDSLWKDFVACPQAKSKKGKKK